MAHGFLTPTPVSGDNFWKNAKSLYDGLNWLRKQFRKDLSVVNVNVKEVRNILEGKDQKALPPAASKMLGGSKPKGLLPGKAGIVNTQAKTDIVGKNATDIDRKEQKYLGTTDPDVAGGPRTRKGGTFVDFSSTDQAKPLNDTNFFSKAVNEGVDANTGEYLSKEARIAAFQKGKVARNPDQGAPPISPDSGADIVAAVNRNTEAIMRMVDATKAQTSNDSNLAQQQIQAQETMMSRSVARAEEKSLEQGSDLSGFMTPENFAKKKQQEAKKETGSKLKEIIRGPNPFKDGGCGCGIGGGGGGFDMPTGRRGRRSPRAKPRARGGALAIPDMVRPKASMPGAGGILRRGGGKALTRGAAVVGGKAAAKGVAKGLGKMGLKKIPGVGAIAGAAFAAERAMKGDWLGAGGELLSGLAGTIPGVGTAVSAGIDAGLMARDAGLTPFARGGIITQPTQGLVGEAGQEGVFPLEGKRGRDTFRMFGEGLIEAQKKAKDEFSKIQAAGLKFYFQNQDGFKFFGNVLKVLFAPFLKPLEALGALGGGLLNSLLGGPANAATMPGGGFASADEQQLTEALIAGEEGVRTEAYQDSEGIWTIGYGQTTLNGRAVKQGDKISKEEALSGFRSNVKSHAQRAINQVGEERWKQLDPKARAVLTSLAYNYGSIPEAVLPAAKSGSTEDIAKSMDELYGHNRGVLKGRRQREQSILRGNMQGTAGNAVRLDKDFLAGGKFAGAGTGPRVMGAAAGQGGKVVEYLTGDRTSSGYRADHGGGNYHDHIAFDSKQTRDAAAAFLKTKGWKIGSMNDGRHADGSYHYSDQAFDIPFYPNQSIKGVPDNASGETQLSSALRRDLAMGGFTGAGVAAVPGGPVGPNTLGNPNLNIPGAPQLSAVLNQNNTGQRPPMRPPAATPSPLFSVSSANPNTGTPIMATSAQVAMAGAAPSGAAPTIINNYYGGGQQSGGVNPNGVAAGIDMNAAGLSAFQDLKIRALS